MSIFAQLMLFGWVPITLGIFSLMPPKRAIMVSVLAGWLFLPYGGYSVEGLPDYGKMTALPLGLLVSLLVFAPGPLLSFRPRWFDLPMLVFCASLFVSDLLNGDSLYSSLSDIVTPTAFWGVVYLVGRIYLNEWKDAHEYMKYVVIGCLVYLPLCIYESKMSPVLSLQLYGFSPTFYQGTRMGLGYRPIIFMGSGLEVGIFMMAGAMLAYVAWLSGKRRILPNQSAGTLVAITVFGAFIVKSVGAMQLGVLGMFVLWLVKRARSMTLLFVLMLLPIGYEVARATHWWTGENLVTWNREYFGDDRADSLDFRLRHESMLIDKALERPGWGWGGSGRFRVFNERGQDISVTDGYWIIILGSQGLVGLVAMNVVFLLPTILFAYRYSRNRILLAADLSSVLAMVIFLVLYLMDSLANAFPSPIYGLMCGILTGLLGTGNVPQQAVAALALREQGDARAEAGDTEGARLHYEQAAAEYSRLATIEPRDPAHRLGLAACDDALASLFDRLEPGEEAVALRLRQLALCEALANEHPTQLSYRRGLAAALGALGRSFRGAGRYDEARDAWLRAIEVWETMTPALVLDAALASECATAYNDAAWNLVGHPDRRPDDLIRAVELARQAVEADPNRDDFWNTLGTAYYHAGQWDSAITSLRASCDLNGGGTAYDHFLLAMAYHHAGVTEGAVSCYQRALDWMHEQGAGQPELAHLQQEAESTIWAVETSPDR